MKNPSEYTLAELNTLMMHDDNGPFQELKTLVQYVRDRQEKDRQYQVRKDAEAITRFKAMHTESPRKLRSLDAELLNACELVAE